MGDGTGEGFPSCHVKHRIYTCMLIYMIVMHEEGNSSATKVARIYVHVYCSKIWKFALSEECRGCLALLYVEHTLLVN